MAIPTLLCFWFYRILCIFMHYSQPDILCLISSAAFCVQIKSVKTGSISWSTGTALSYFYMVSVHRLLQLLSSLSCYVIDCYCPKVNNQMLTTNFFVVCGLYYMLLFMQVSAWGGYVFIINLIPLHVFVLLLMGRYSNRIFVGKKMTLFCRSLKQKKLLLF